METIILAGGCFWGMEELFRQLSGVTGTRVGYSGGTIENPTYHLIRSGDTGHAESLEITFDPKQITLNAILAYFFQIHDPTTPNQQGNDRGSQYRSIIFYADDQQKEAAQEVIDAVNASGKWPGKVVTELLPAGPFYDAEIYHQHYLQKNPGGYTCHWERPDWVV